MELVRVIPGGAERAVAVGHGIEALFYPNGEVAIAHDCRVVDLPSRPVQLRTAPRLRLGNGHTIVRTEPLTVIASILCEDCGLHGWITDGVWVEA